MNMQATWATVGDIPGGVHPHERCGVWRRA